MFLFITIIYLVGVLVIIELKSFSLCNKITFKNSVN